MVYLTGTSESLQSGFVLLVDMLGSYSTNVQLNGTLSDNGTVQARVTTQWGTVTDWVFDDVSQSGT